MGTLYVVTMPTGDPDDIPFRALRILGEVPLLVAADGLPEIRNLLDCHGIGTAVVATPGEQALLAALNEGDVALLVDDRQVAPRRASLGLIQAAIEGGFAVMPVPGPSPAIASLVASGLPAHSFVYLGELPGSQPARLDLLTAAAGQERTLLLSAPSDRLDEVVADLHQALGERPLVVVPRQGEPGCEGSGSGTSKAGMLAARRERGIWRGTTAGPVDWGPGPAPARLCVLVVGGAQEFASLWEEERLRTEIGIRLNRDQRTREISRDLAVASGWPRREVYRLTVELVRDRGREKPDRSSL